MINMCTCKYSDAGERLYTGSNYYYIHDTGLLGLMRFIQAVTVFFGLYEPSFVGTPQVRR